MTTGDEPGAALDQAGGRDGLLRRGVGGAIALLDRSTTLRFLIVGAFNTVSSILVYLLLLWVGLPFPIANLGSLLFGIGLAFTTQGRFVFRDSSARNLVPFLITWAAIYLAQTGLIWLLVRQGLTPAIAGLVVFPVVVLASFILQRSFVFNRRR